jgi:hypothetical protein
MEQFECMVDKALLRSSNGIMKTEGLFIESASKINSMTNRLAATPIYTLKDYDKPGYPSMYLIYIDCVTEYEAAMKLLGSYRHWKKLCQSTMFIEYLEEWREERKARDEAVARTTLLASVVDGNVSAAKTIMDESKRKGAGRPSKVEVAGEMSRAVKDQAHLENIVDRMRSV